MPTRRSATASWWSAPERSAAWPRGSPDASTAATSSWWTSTRSERLSPERSACGFRQRKRCPTARMSSFTPADRRRASIWRFASPGFEATIVELSWYGDQVVPIALGQAFHARRLTIKSSQVGSVAASQRARWDSRRRMQLALASLADPALDALITGETRFESLPQVMADLADGSLDAICHRVRYDERKTETEFRTASTFCVQRSTF